MIDTEKVAEKIIKIILIIAGLSIVFFIVSTFFPSPKEGSILQALILLPVIPIIMGIVILFKLRSASILPPFLRIIGWIIFFLWILSFFIDNPFRR